MRTNAASWPVLSLFLALAAGDAQRNTSRTFAPGQCGPVDPAYIQTATETGGQPFFLSPAEIAKSATIMLESSRPDAAMVLWASGTKAEGARELTFPVDGSLTRLTITATFDTTGGSIVITSPGGPVIPTEETVFNCGRAVTVDAPAADIWRVALAPSGRFWLVAHGRSELDLLSAEFVAKGGRPGHEGLFKIQGQPVAGSQATLRVRLTGDHAKNLRFSFVSTRGELIRNLPLTRNGDDEFDGIVALPNEPFRVAVRGVDAAGATYQRMFPTLFHAELVEVRPAGSVDQIAPGQERAVEFIVRNAGPAADYRILAVTTQRITTRAEPAVLQIPAGGERRMSVSLSAPPDMDPGTAFDLIVTASASSPRPTTNSAIVHLTIARREAP